MRDEILTAPRDISAEAAAGLSRVRFVAAKNADRTKKGPWLTVRGVRGGRLDEVELLDEAGEAEVNQFSQGIFFEGCDGLRVSGLRVSGAGYLGVNIRAGRDLVFEDVETTRCFTGFGVESQWTPTYGLTVRRARLHDNWNPIHALNPTPASVLRPGEHMGWSGFGLHGVVDGLIEDVVIYGESAGAKLTSCRGVTVRRLLTAHLSLKGQHSQTTGNPPHHWDNPAQGIRDVVLEWMVLRKSLTDSDRCQRMNGVQASRNVDATLVDCELLGQGHPGHAIQAADGARIRLQRGLVGGWNGIAVDVPAAAFDVKPSSASEITYDGTVFVDQERIWSGRSIQ